MACVPVGKAPFQSLEDGAFDSTRENIRQAGANSGPMPVCLCSGLLPSGCGDGIVCNLKEQLYRQTCNPIGCEVDLIAAGVIMKMQDCMPDPPPGICCDAPQSTGNCGALASNVPGGCPEGQMEVRKMCGSPTETAVYSCVVNAACNNDCQPFGPFAQGWCNPTTYNIGVIGLQPPNFVNNGDCNLTTDMKCKAECKATAYAIAGTCLPGC